MYTVVHVQKTSSLYTNSHILLFIRGTRTVPYRTGLQVPVTRDAPCETTFFVFVCFFFFPTKQWCIFLHTRRLSLLELDSVYGDVPADADDRQGGTAEHEVLRLGLLLDRKKRDRRHGERKRKRED